MVINVTALNIKLVKKFQAAISELYVLAVLGLTPSVGGTCIQKKSKYQLSQGQLQLIGWLVVLGYWPFETVFQSISGPLPKRGRKRRERIDESKHVQTTPTHTYCKRSRPLPYCYPNCRTPRHWKFTQHHRTTRPPPA